MEENLLRSPDLKDIRITDAFWRKRIDVAQNISIDYMWKAINDEIEGITPSGCMRNFRIAAGLEKGDFYGFQFQDSDLYKWLEAVGYSLQTKPDSELEARADSAIDLMEKAQLDDGYLDTYYIIKDIGKRWTCLRDMHELYVAGHMMEAACAYCKATGKRKVLDIACRFADHICTVFGPGEGQKKGIPGHQEVELGLLRLYGVTGNRKYLEQAKFFLDERGQQPCYFDTEAADRGEKKETYEKAWSRVQGRDLPYNYQQAHKPVREQKEAVGHAVRCCYMLSAMAECAGLTGDESLDAAAETLWRDITEKQMYLTAGVGSQSDGESFSFDYDLPNDRMYNETCASIALLMSAKRLFERLPRSSYEDVAERALFNGILSGISLDGTRFFYCNPMEVWPERAKRRADMHIDTVRQGWYGCACCPTNVLRTLTGLGAYIWSRKDDTVYLNQYIASEARISLPGGDTVLELKGSYPYSGKMTLTVREAASLNLALRIPGWCESFRVSCGGREYERSANGYVYLREAFAAGAVISIELDMTPRKVYCSANVPFNAGRAALTRGPLVYCMEEADNGKQLWNLKMTDSAVSEQRRSEPEEMIALTIPGLREESAEGALYTARKKTVTPKELTFIPYYAWCNRGEGEMQVWVRDE
ncbi:MAG: hypothetical protein CW338_10040 [Clostridiales bacterium]|nr:hypothetical protein [Clostridiales bacterium]